jgi:hypothetical protein
VGFETINMVLKRLRSPVIIDRGRLEKGFANANECFLDLGKLPKLIPANCIKASWERMSEIFAGNAQGDIKVMDGCADDFRRIGRDKVLIDKELEALMKNSALSEPGKKVLKALIGKYGAEFDRRYTALMKQIMADKEALKGKPK